MSLWAADPNISREQMIEKISSPDTAQRPALAAAGARARSVREQGKAS
jgi:hypothetical protein